MMIFLNIGLYIGLSVGLAGCVFQNKVKKSVGSSREPALFSSTQKIAQSTYNSALLSISFLDIPVPLHAIPEEALPDEGGDCHQASFYVERSDPEEIYDFFLYQMECCGWRYMHGVRGKEFYASFKKPQRWCSLVISSYKKGARLTLFMDGSL